ncbi:DEAD/DEAH box helicase [Salisediminibacterium beveridgei]|uniref:Helicase, SNF2/RAD54 family n=1 Tax=Salisediminibacterium beveridgei TaxID=632773 RepID=A0A1D7QX01_9BACI|nr:DEAD/DEAH box helicase [Salisediminibacterium beveridgei]AOM83537.1 Helicase, SNF2/RAD54 family [Salisediminibacterium beveridgei]
MALKDFFKTNRGKVKIQIQTELESDGINYRILRNDEHLNFPLQMTIQDFSSLSNSDMELLQSLQYLWDEDRLKQHAEGYLIRSDSLYSGELDEVKEYINIPDTANDIKAELQASGYIGSTSFELFLNLQNTHYSQIQKTGSVQGPFITLPGHQTVLMPEAIFKVLKEIDRRPKSSNNQEILRYIARVKHFAQQLGLSISSFIEKQDYRFVDHVDVDMTYDGKSIEFKPEYQSAEDRVETHVLQDIQKNDLIYKKDGTSKYFVDPSVQKHSAAINNMRPISGSDIPKFVNNPEAYIDTEEIDLDISMFSERVKELGIKVYKTQPFVHGRESEKGWFELELGADIKNENGDIMSAMDVDELTSLTQQAREKGEDFIPWDDGWVEIPEEVDEFIEASKTVTELQEGKETHYPPGKIPYVLEIFENVAKLEYSPELLSYKELIDDPNILSKDVPGGFRAVLRPFQQDGYVWMKSLSHQGLGGLLADDMGLGKTIQVLALLAYLDERQELQPGLIIVPKTLIENWINEAQKFYPELSPNIYVHSGNKRLTNVRSIEHYKLVITTYDTLSRDQLLLGRIDWSICVCDEAQAIKNPTTSRSKALKAMKAKRRLAMTGTPVENSLSELWSIMDFVQPGLLGSLNEFKAKYIDTFEKSGNYDELENQIITTISSVYKRRTKTGELKGQLPEKREELFSVPFGNKQKQLYANVLERAKNKEIVPLEAIQYLKRICSHPGLENKSLQSIKIKEVPKLFQTLNLIKNIQSKGEKVLIFTEYIDMQVILKRHIMNTFGIEPVIINGKTNRRQVVVDHFNRKEGFDVMILSPKAAGTGLTITSANHVIHYTRWWNPAVENQATDRVYRIGQERDVTVYYPIVSTEQSQGETVEQIIHRIIENKKELSNNVIIPSKQGDIKKEIMGQLKH